MLSWSVVFQFNIFLSDALRNSRNMFTSGPTSSPCNSFFRDIYPFGISVTFFQFPYFTSKCFRFLWIKSWRISFCFCYFLESPFLFILLDTVSASFKSRFSRQYLFIYLFQLHYHTCLLFCFILLLLLSLAILISVAISLPVLKAQIPIQVSYFCSSSLKGATILLQANFAPAYISTFITVVLLVGIFGNNVYFFSCCNNFFYNFVSREMVV